MREREFFNGLLSKTAEAYNKSQIKNENWFYSISSTKLIKGAPLIVGFNWGVNENHTHTPQKEYPGKNFVENYNELGSLKRTIPYFEIYHKKALEGVQTNFCFFRSKKENQIKHDDLLLSIPLFEELVDYLRSVEMISFSNRLKRYLLETGKIVNYESKSLKTAKGEISVLKGSYKHDHADIRFSYLPHPNYPLKRDLRTAAWEFVFNR